VRRLSRACIHECVCAFWKAEEPERNRVRLENKKAHEEAISLISAGVHKSNPMLIFPLVSCMVDNGTAAVTTDSGIVTHDIMVIEGPKSGCRGNIPVEHFEVSR
jgi:hypothetical protein